MIMMYKAWRVCLLKRGAHVLVNVNYNNPHGAPERWASGTLIGVAQYGRLCRVLLDDKGDHRWAGTTNVFIAARVKRAITTR
jgi:hypothetical protein